MTNKKSRIVIVDDNRIIREVLRGLIRHDETLQVVGSAASGEAALEMIGSLRPDLVCLDVLMPGLDGIAVLRAIHSAYPGTRVILVSGESRAEVVTRALRAGASGFVVKPFNAEKVLRTIHAALRAPVPECHPEPAIADDAADKDVTSSSSNRPDQGVGGGQGVQAAAA